MRASIPSFEALLSQLEEARRLTLDLVSLTSDDELRSVLLPGFSPVGWHLGHIAFFEERWIHQRAHGESVSSHSHMRLFDPLVTPKHDRNSLPNRRRLLDLVDDIRQRTVHRLASDAARLERDPFASHAANPDLVRDLFIYRLVLDHELQHAETIAVLLRQRPRSRREEACAWFGRPTSELPLAPPKLVRIDETEAVVGEPSRLVGYDNERPPMTVKLAAFEVDSRPVTNGDWLRFMEADGYRRREWWSDEGWRFREENRLEHPFYWERQGSDWRLRAFAGDVPLPLSHPVEGVSAFEAEAYARWAGKRLLREAEWECAARQFATPVPASGLRMGGTWPVSETGDYLGNVWEWTADSFAPYPDFRPDPYPEYSASWFDGRHRVLRGGSWATHRRLARPAFRNWFPPETRAIFAGLRCARDVRDR